MSFNLVSDFKHLAPAFAVVMVATMPTQVFGEDGDRDSSSRSRYSRTSTSKSTPSRTRSSLSSRSRSNSSRSSSRKRPNSTTSKDRYRRKSPSKDRYRRDKDPRNRFETGTRKPGGGSTEASNQSGGVSQNQIRSLERKIDELERFKTRAITKIEQLKKSKETKGTVAALEARVQALEVQSNSAIIEAQIKSINDSIKNIKQVINTIPGVSI